MVVAAVCVTAIHGWSVVAILQRIPGWSMYLNAWELISAFAYTQVFAFVEDALLVLLLVALAVLLPTFVRQNFVAQSTLLVAALIGWAACAHSQHPGVASTPAAPLLVIGAVVLISHRVLTSFPRVGQAVADVAERFTIFLYVHVPVVVGSFLIVLARNVL